MVLNLSAVPVSVLVYIFYAQQGMREGIETAKFSFDETFFVTG